MKTTRLCRLGLLLGLCFMALNTKGANESSSSPNPGAIFEQRILPIFKSPNPSSCVQCHLSAVDLKDYILPSQEKTFASLRAQGLIDLEHPEKSKILELIKMGERDLDKGAALIHESMRQAEYDAFAAWIAASSRDPSLRNLPAPNADDQARPEQPDEIIRHARKNRVLDSFVRNVWSQRMRCYPCHTPYEIQENDSKHEMAMNRLKEMEQQWGRAFSHRLRIFRKTPEETMAYLIDRSSETPEGRLPLINLEHPEKSLLVLKPTSKLPKKTGEKEFEKPSSVEPVSHMGGLKMHPDDFSYKAFMAWIQDYARVVGNQYQSADELPADNWYLTRHMILVRETPPPWAATARVQLFVHPWNEARQAWAAEPIAFTQGTVTPKRTLFGALFLLRSPGTEKSADWESDDPTLASGKYLLKAYVDSKMDLAKDPARLLGQEHFYGQGEILAQWGKGFPNAEKLMGALFEKP